MPGMRTPTTGLPIKDPSLPRLSAKTCVSARRAHGRSFRSSAPNGPEIDTRPCPRLVNPSWNDQTSCRRARRGSSSIHYQRDVTTVLVLLLGSFVVPVLGWVVGVVLLWNGPRWNTRQNWMGTLIWPIVALAFLVIHSAVVRPLSLVIALAGLVAEFIFLLRATARQRPRPPNALVSPDRRADQHPEPVLACSKLRWRALRAQPGYWLTVLSQRAEFMRLFSLKPDALRDGYRAGKPDA